MWPLWLIIAVATGGAVSLTVSGVLLAVHLERKRHRKLIAQYSLDRNISQYHRPHLSINDVDFAALPRPTRSLRQSIVSPRRDSRFYSTMPSEDEVRAFPDGSTESVADAFHIHTDTISDRPNQWLSPSKSGRKDKRKKKTHVLSISAPMARSPLSAVMEVTESERAGSPAPVELPTQTTPKVTPEKSVDYQHNPMPSHAPQGSIDSIMSTGRSQKRVSQRISHGNALKSRAISMGSIESLPPDCPLPPVPRGMPKSHSESTNPSRLIPEINTQHQDISLLNSPLSSKQDNLPVSPKLSNAQLKLCNGFSGFNFGLEDGTVQVITVEQEQNSHTTSGQSELQRPPHSAAAAPRAFSSEESFKTIDASKWNLPGGFRHLGPSTPSLSANSSEVGSRPISAISLTGYNDLTTPSHSPSKMSFDPLARPVSVSSVDVFRNSIVGPNAPVLAPESPRSRGHKRQNCVRISGLTSPDAANKRLSSQLRRLSEAEEIDLEDSKCVGLEMPALCTANPLAAPAAQPLSDMTLAVPKVSQPQALSLRVKRPGIHSVRKNQSRDTLQADTSNNIPNQQLHGIADHEPQGSLTRSKTTEPHFVYQGSPASDPTKPPRAKQEFSPVSPSSLILTPEKKQSQPQPQMMYSPASPSMLNNPATNTTSPRRSRIQLHGPRSIPPPSLRTRNRTSPGLRQGERSGSPIRKSSASNATRQRSTSQDDIKRSLALLKTLTHAAQSSSGLPDVNLVKSYPAERSDGAHSRTPSTHHIDNRALNAPAQRSRHRSKTVGGQVPPSMFDPPRVRPEMRLLPQQQHQQQQGQRAEVMPPTRSKFPYSPSDISIWEDVSVKSDSPEVSTKPTPTAASTRPGQEKPRHEQSSEKESVYRLQQNTDQITSRALALGGNSPKTSDESGAGNRKVSKVVDGYWGSHPQPPTARDLAKIRENIGQVSRQTNTKQRARSTVNNVRDGWANATATGYGAPGPRSRQRSHTVAASGRPMNGTEMKMKEGVGLGVDFGKMGGLRTTFFNDMERDGIGRLR